MLINRSYASIKRLANKLIGQCNQIIHRRITKGKPWENGYVEAQHRIDQERLYDTMRVGSLDEAIAAPAEYQGLSNLYPKPCLGMRSPMNLIGEAV